MLLAAVVAQHARPVVVIGPNKDRVIEALVTAERRQYRSCVPHCTRPKRPEEVHGEDYFFVTHEEMQELIANGT